MLKVPTKSLSASEAAPIIGPENNPQKFKDEAMMREDIRAAAGLLSGEGLRSVAAMVRSLLSAKRD